MHGGERVYESRGARVGRLGVVRVEKRGCESGKGRGEERVGERG